MFCELSAKSLIILFFGSKLFHPIHKFRLLCIMEIIFFLQALLHSQRTFVPGDHVAVPGTSEKISF